MKNSTIFVAFALALAATAVRAEPQTGFYGPDGRSVSVAVPQGQGTVRYYDSRGRSLGTSTTMGGTSKFYDARGRPAGSFQFDGRMRRPAIPGTAR
jgi:YD repeat-containing protein